MRRWVKDESVRLKDLLEHTHGKTLPELAPVETAPRAVSRPELIAPVAEN